MINFRFHVVSLVAVFLALAVGVVMGYGVLSQPTVDALNDRIARVERRADSIKAENDELRDESSRLKDYLTGLAPHAVSDQLSVSTVVVVATRGIDDKPVHESVVLARQASATVSGVVWLEAKWKLGNDDDTTALANQLGIPTSRKNTVRDAGWRLLAERLVSGGTNGRDDLLATLQQSGFISFDTVGGPDTTVSRIDGRGAQVLLIGGPKAAMASKQSVVPLVDDLVAIKAPVVVGEVWASRENGPRRGALLSPIRGSDTLSRTVSTVDDVDLTQGRIAAVLALADLTRNVVGQYGIGEGAGDGQLPAPVSP